MKFHAVLFLALGLAALPAFAAVDGTVTNRTSGKPQANVVVTLVQPSQQGMQTLGSMKTGAAGKFHFDKDAPAGGPQLIQATFAGVMYTKMIQPDAASTGVSLDVYDSSTDASVAKVGQDVIVYQPSESQLTVNEVVIFQNASTTTYNDPKHGTLNFYLPPSTNGGVQVSITAPGGMPVNRPAEKTADADIYSVSFPIKPGETQFNIVYALAIETPMVVSGKILRPDVTKLAVPTGLVIDGDNVTLRGQVPDAKVTLYDVKGSEYRAELTSEGEGEPPIVEAQPALYSKLFMGESTFYWILGIVLLMLGCGLFLLYRSDKTGKVVAAEGEKDAAAAPARKGAMSR